MQEPYLRLGQDVGLAITRLSELITEAGNVSTGGSNTADTRNRYLVWLEIAESQLRNIFSDSAIWQGLFTERSWRVRALNSDSPRPAPLLHHEIEWQSGRLQEIYDRLQYLRTHFSIEPNAVVIVPDTNLFLHFLPLEQIPWTELADTNDVRFVVPLLVIDELDDISHRDRGRSEQARKTIHMLQDLRGERPPEESVPISSGVTMQVLIDPPGHQRRTNHDDEILTRAQYLKLFCDGRVLVASADYGMRLRASSRGLSHLEIDDRYSRNRQAGPS